jgi:hypothetical protein
MDDHQVDPKTIKRALVAADKEMKRLNPTINTLLVRAGFSRIDALSLERAAGDYYLACWQHKHEEVSIRGVVEADHAFWLCMLKVTPAELAGDEVYSRFKEIVDESIKKNELISTNGGWQHYVVARKLEEQNLGPVV